MTVARGSQKYVGGTYDGLKERLIAMEDTTMETEPKTQAYFSANGQDYSFPQDSIRLERQRREDETAADVDRIMSNTETTILLFTGVPEDKIVPYLLWFEAMHGDTVVSWRPHITSYYDRNLDKLVTDTSRYKKVETSDVFRRNYVVEIQAPGYSIHYGRHKVDLDFYNLRLSDYPNLSELTVGIHPFNGTWMAPETYTVGFLASLPPWLTAEKLTNLIDTELKSMDGSKPYSFHLEPDYWSPKSKHGKKKSSTRKTIGLRLKATDSNIAREEIDALLGSAGVLNVATIHISLLTDFYS